MNEERGNEWEIECDLDRLSILNQQTTRLRREKLSVRYPNAVAHIYARFAFDYRNECTHTWLVKFVNEYCERS